MRKHKKQGIAYEQVLAEVIRVMDPGVSINQGSWVMGPDGVRELDVHIVGTYEGKNRQVLIECKDFNPVSSGPVGIGLVDALESKVRDLGFDFAAICSNAGFTEGAVRKASRVGIGLIAVMKKGDARVRFQVSEEIFTRKVNVTSLNISLKGPEPISLNGISFESVLFEGIPVGNWVTRKVMLVLGSNPIVAGSYTAEYPLSQPLTFHLPKQPVIVTELVSHLTITGGWFSQQVTLDATKGLYDWLRHRVRLASGPGEFLIQGVDIYSGSPVPQPPSRELNHTNIIPGEIVMRLLLVSGLEPHDPVPDLDRYIRDSDLDPVILNLPPEAYTSVGA